MMVMVVWMSKYRSVSLTYQKVKRAKVKQRVRRASSKSILVIRDANQRGVDDTIQENHRIYQIRVALMLGINEKRMHCIT